jgi:hypothetical protein
MNAIIYMTTGKQINEAEAARMLTARGIGPTASQQAFNVGVPALEAEMRRAAKAYKAKYRPEVYNAMKERGGLEWLDQLLSEGAPELTDLKKKYGL